MASLLVLSGLSWSVPDYSSLNRRQSTLQLAIPYRRKDSLHLLIDSTGGKGRAVSTAAPSRSIWRKIHMAADEETLKIHALEVTSSIANGALILPDLFGQIAPQEVIICVTADGAYDSGSGHDAIAAKGAFTIIGPHKTARLWRPTTDEAKARNEALQTSKRFGIV